MRRRTSRSVPAPTQRRKAIAVAVARPALPVRALAILFALALLALVLPRLAGAAPEKVLRAEPAVVATTDAAVLRLQTSASVPVLVEFGLAPNVDRVVRSSVGTEHELRLDGLEPGRIYVYRVIVNGQVVGRPTPFRTTGVAEKPVLRADLELPGVDRV